MAAAEATAAAAALNVPAAAMAVAAVGTAVVATAVWTAVASAVGTAVWIVFVYIVRLLIADCNLVTQSVSKSYTTPIHGGQRSLGRTRLQTTICSLNLLLQFSTCNRTSVILPTNMGGPCGRWVRLTGRVMCPHVR